MLAEKVLLMRPMDLPGCADGWEWAIFVRCWRHPQRFTVASGDCFATLEGARDDMLRAARRLEIMVPARQLEEAGNEAHRQDAV